MTLTHNLQARGSTGRLKYWQMYIGEDAQGPHYYTISFNETASGGTSKPVRSANVYTAPKNVGRANETTAMDQAQSESDSIAAKKTDKGYWPVGEPEPKMRALPMLAQSYDKHAKKIEYPALVQPKADGVRCLTDGSTFWSRGGKDFPAECVEHLRWELPKGVILDGELMLEHGEHTFQETVSATKKFKPLSRELKLFVYDCIIVDRPNMGFWERFSFLEYYIENMPAGFELHPTFCASNEAEMKELHGEFTTAGWEGTIIRNREAPYKVNGRSYDLQKYKQFIDDEYEVVDVVEGVGKFVGHAVLVCQTPSGQTFKATPKGGMPFRKSLFENKQDYIGQMYTIRYQELTDDGIPRFPIGIAVRDYE